MRLIPTSTLPVTITLYRGVPFSNKYEEHSLMSTKFVYKNNNTAVGVSVGHNKEDLLNIVYNSQYKYPRTTKTGTYNFAYGNGLVTSVVMELTGDEINSNYMKVVPTNVSLEGTYYYFITGIIQKNETTYLLNLELDVFMTYGDEFLTNIADKPVMVERKHCRRLLCNNYPSEELEETTNSIMYHQETTFNGIKNNIVQNVVPLELYVKEGFRELYWYYIIYEQIGDKCYHENDFKYPYTVFVFPNKPFIFKFNGGQPMDIYHIFPEVLLNKFVGDPKVQKIIISPYPPFKKDNNIALYFDDNLNNYVFEVTSATSVSGQSTYEFYSGTNNTGSFFRYYWGNSTSIYENCPVLELREGFGGEFGYVQTITPFNYFSPDEISITKYRDANEFKLQIAPFKEIKMSSYYGNELYVATNNILNGKNLSSFNELYPTTIVSSNPEVCGYYNYVDTDNNDISAKKGSYSAVSYNLPTSVNALELFNQTQRNQFETSKSNATLSNGFKLVSSTLVGGMQIASGHAVKGASTMISGIGGSVIGEIENIRSHNAKLADLENTPEKYSFGGTSFPFDLAMSYSNHYIDSEYKNLFPYIITYTTTYDIKEMASEFLYHYGYEYNKESFFATTITMNTDNIFERRLFNYVKIREDITTKLVGDNLPLIVAEKMNEVLNAGIKFWTFFSMNLQQTSVGTNVIDNYFQKSKYCNAELNAGNLN